MTRHLAHLVVLGLFAAGGAGCSIDIGAHGGAATGVFERTLTVTGPVELDVRTGSGSVVVRRGGDREVRVTGHVRARGGWFGAESPEERVRAIEAQPPITQEGDIIRLGPRSGETWHHVSISYELVVPLDTGLRAQTGSGRVEVDSVNGPVTLRTGSGSIALGRIASAAAAETGSGSIDILGAGGGLTARTGSGSIRARDLAGSVRASTGSGRIEVSFAGPGEADLGTGSGSIAVSGLDGALHARTGSGSIAAEGTPAERWTVESGSGSITLRLPPDAAFDLDARSRGSVRIDHPITETGARRRHRLQGSVRGGGPFIRLSSGSGSIRID